MPCLTSVFWCQGVAGVGVGGGRAVPDWPQGTTPWLLQHHLRASAGTAPGCGGVAGGGADGSRGVDAHTADTPTPSPGAETFLPAAPVVSRHPPPAQTGLES